MQCGLPILARMIVIADWARTALVANAVTPTETVRRLWRSTNTHSDCAWNWTSPTREWVRRFVAGLCRFPGNCISVLGPVAPMIQEDEMEWSEENVIGRKNDSNFKCWNVLASIYAGSRWSSPTPVSTEFITLCIVIWTDWGGGATTTCLGSGEEIRDSTAFRLKNKMV